MIEVTVPLTVTASMTFHVDSEGEVTEDMIQGRINMAQRTLDHRGEDPETGIYLTIDGHARPEFYDPKA